VSAEYARRHEIKRSAVTQVDLGQRFKVGTNAFHVHVLSGDPGTDFLTTPFGLPWLCAAALGVVWDRTWDSQAPERFGSRIFGLPKTFYKLLIK
jgi:hypothetical protein